MTFFPHHWWIQPTASSCQFENKVEKKGWNLEKRGQKCLSGLEYKFDCLLCQRLQNYSAIHASEAWDKYTFIDLKIIPKISNHQVFFQTHFPKSKSWYFKHISHRRSVQAHTHCLSLLLLTWRVIWFSNYFLSTLFFAQWRS